MCSWTHERRLEMLISGSRFGTAGFSPRRGGGYRYLLSPTLAGKQGGTVRTTSQRNMESAS
jgi:hypothetical protein